MDKIKNNYFYSKFRMQLKKSPIISTIFGTVIGSLIVYGLTEAGKFGWSYFYRNEEFLSIAIDNAPKFEITDIPEPDSLVLTNDSTFINNYIFSNKLRFPTKKKFNIPGYEIQCNLTFFIKNTSHFGGKYLAHCVSIYNVLDTPIRDTLLNSIIEEERIEFHEDISLDKDDNLKLNFPVLTPYNKDLIIHIYILYQNKYNQLFDTYNWYCLKILEPEPLYIFKGGYKGKVLPQMIHQKIKSYLLLRHKSPEYHVYDYFETERIYNLLKYNDYRYDKIKQELNL